MTAEGIILLFITVFTLVLFYYVFRIVTVSKVKPSILSFFYFKFFLSIYFGVVALNIFDYGFIQVNLLLQMYVLSTISIVMVAFGALIANSFIIKRGNRLEYGETSNAYKSIEGIPTFIVLSVLMICAVVTLIYYRNMLGGLPIETLFSDGVDAKLFSELRSQATNAFQGKYYRIRILIETIPLFILVVAFFLRKKNFRWTLFFGLMVIYNILVSVRDFQKGPVVNVFILLAVCHIFSANKLSKKFIVGMGLALTTVVGLMYMFFMGLQDRDSLSIAGAMFKRVFISQATPLYYYLLYWQEYGNLWGLSFPNPGSIFPFENIGLTREISSFMGAGSEKAVGSAPTVYFGEWLLNFGYAGAILSMILLGFILQSIDILFSMLLRKKMNLFILSLYVFLIIYLGRFAGTSYTGLVFDINLYILFFITFILSMLGLRRMLVKTPSRHVQSVLELN